MTLVYMDMDVDVDLFVFSVAAQDAAVTSVGRSCPRLRSLHLSECTGVTDDGLRSVAEHCQGSLTTIHLFGCRHLADEAVLEIAVRCTHLTSLDISCCCVSSQSVQALARARGAALEVLYLFDCSAAIDDEALVALGEHCARLRTLDVSFCMRVSDDGISAVAHGCPNLHTLSVGGCSLVTGAAIELVAASCAQLMRLDSAPSPCCTPTSPSDPSRSTHPIHLLPTPSPASREPLPLPCRVVASGALSAVSLSNIRT